MQVTICTAANDFQTFYKTPPAPTAYATLPITATAPAGDGVIDKGGGKQNPGKISKIVFWAVGTSTSSFSAKIVGYTQTDGEWWPITLADVLCTIGASRRANGTENVVGTIAINSGLVVANYEIVPADNGIQVLKLDLMGCQRIKLVPGPKTGTCSAINAGISDF